MRQTKCPQCGAPFPERALGGLCPICVASALSDEFIRPTRLDEISDSDIPGFLMQEILGEGGSGIVWAALEIDPPHREVALKILKSASRENENAIRFEAEMAALSLMDHPGIARVFRSGKTCEGIPFFAMERIDGPPITQFQGCLKTKIKLFQQVCDAVGHAHRKGVIHRDLKPSNVLVDLRGSQAQAKVIDFGIAKATDALLTEKTLLTRAHQFLGTPAYMSPEQAAMKGDAIDTRSDIYSLGVLFFEILTGKTPIAFERLDDLPYDEILRRIREHEAPRPSTVVDGLDRDLDWIVLKALSKDPALRYETADAFSRDIQQLIQGRAIKARPPTKAYRVKKFVRQHRGRLAVATTLVFALVAGTVISSLLYFKSEKHRKEAVANEQKAKEIFSNADFLQASSLIEAGRPALAVAHLTRAVRTNPDHRAASEQLLFTLASESWATPISSIPRGGYLHFLSDGDQILHFTDLWWQRDSSQNHSVSIHDSENGREISRLPTSDAGRAIALSHDEKLLAHSTWDGHLMVWDLSAGKLIHHVREPQPERGSAMLEFSPDSSRLLASFKHASVQVWDCRNWKVERTLSLEKRKGPARFDLSTDGTEVVVFAETVAKVFCVATGASLTPLLKHGDEVSGVAHLGQGRVVSWGREGIARVWDIQTGKPIMTLPHESWVRRGIVSPDATRLLTGTSTGEKGGIGGGFVRMWDLKTGQLISPPLNKPGSVRALAFSKDGSRAAAGSLGGGLGEGTVSVLDGRTGEPICPPIFHPRGARAITLNHNGTRLAVGSRHKNCIIWDLSGQKIQPLTFKQSHAAWRVIFENDGTRLITLGEGGQSCRWDARNGKRLSFIRKTGPLAVEAHRGSLSHGFLDCRFGHRREWKAIWENYFRVSPFADGSSTCFAASEDGERIFVGSNRGIVQMFSIRDGKLLETIINGTQPITKLAFDDQTDRLVCGTDDGSASLWAIHPIRLIKKVTFGSHGGITALAMQPGSEMIALGFEKDAVRLWWPERDPSLSMALRGCGLVNHLAFSPDFSTLAAAGTSNAAFLWDTNSGAPKGPPLRHIDRSTFGLFMKWLPGSQQLMTSGSHDNTSRLWDVSTGRMIFDPMKQSAACVALAVSPDGRRAVVADGDERFKVWDLTTGRPLTALLESHGYPLGCSFDRAGTRIACASKSGWVTVWDLPCVTSPLPAEFLDWAEAVVGFRYNETGVLEGIAGAALQMAHEKARDSLRGREKHAVYSWLSWLLADQSTRGPSPHQAAD